MQCVGGGFVGYVMVVILWSKGLSLCWLQFHWTVSLHFKNQRFVTEFTNSPHQLWTFNVFHTWRIMWWNNLNPLWSFRDNDYFHFLLCSQWFVRPFLQQQHFSSSCSLYRRSRTCHLHNLSWSLWEKWRACNELTCWFPYRSAADEGVLSIQLSD